MYTQKRAIHGQICVTILLLYGPFIRELTKNGLFPYSPKFSKNSKFQKIRSLINGLFGVFPYKPFPYKRTIQYIYIYYGFPNVYICSSWSKSNFVSFEYLTLPLRSYLFPLRFKCVGLLGKSWTQNRNIEYNIHDGCKTFTDLKKKRIFSSQMQF